MIKICFVTTANISIDAFIFPAVPELKKNGFTVTFATSCSEDFLARCREAEIEVHDFKVARGFDLKGTVQAAMRFKKLCEEKQFDMVFFATPNGALYGSIGSRLAGVPCRILGQWGMRYVGFTGWKRRVIRSLEKVACINATDIRNVSRKNRSIAIRDRMYRPEKCKVLGSGGTIGVDLEQYPLEEIPAMRKQIREKLGISEDALTYAFVGRLCRDKGVAELFSAFSVVEKENPNARLLLIGGVDGNGQLPQEMIDQAHENPKIIFAGNVENREVPVYLAAADVLVHPTYREGFGMVLQEGAAMMLPTVTTDIPGASEAIVAEKTGLLAKKQDAESLADAMIRLFDKDLRETLGRRGRQRIEEEFDRKMMVKRLCKDYLELYETRVKGRKG